MKRWIAIFFIIMGALFLVGCTNQGVSITISFNSNGGSFVPAITTDGSSIINLPDDPTKEGYSFSGWYWDNETFNELFTASSLLDRPVSNNLTVYAKWNEEEIPTGSIKVTFNSQGGSEVTPQYVQKGGTLNIPVISKEGHTLDGWYTSVNQGETLDEKWSFTSSIVNNEITLYAKWIINQYTITFHSNGGSFINSIVEDFGATISVPSIPIKEGYSFSGWYQDSLLNNPYEFTTMPAENLNLYAKWTINEYTITFNSNGGSEVSSITQDYGTAVTEPTEPAKEGYIFDGWYSNIDLNSAYTFTTIPAQNTTLYAKWDINQYTITFDSTGGTVVNAITQDYSTFVTKPINPTKTGFTFDGWFIDTSFEDEYMFSTMPASSITLYAKWQVNHYNVYYYYLPDDYDPMIDVSLVPGETVAQIQAGSNFSLALTSTGRVFTWGSNGSGQLGDGTNIDKTTPIEITALFGLSAGETVTQIQAGGAFSLALTSTGRVFTWGFNGSGQLGDGTNISKSTPIEITARFGLTTGETIKQVVAGRSTSLAKTSTGRVFTWGWNYYGQLGDGTTTNKSTPTRININGWIFSMGFDHSLAIAYSNSVFAWGNNQYEQLGDIYRFANTSFPTEMNNTSFNLATGETLSQIVAGSGYSLALTTTGRLFIWGYHNSVKPYNSEVDASLPTNITFHFDLTAGETITKIVGGYYHAFVLTSTGRVFVWGENDFGQLGDGTTINKSTPIEITAGFGLPTGETVTQIQTKGSFSLALTSTGRVFTWGSNGSGQLGDGTNIDKTTPIEILFNPVILFQSTDYYFAATITEIFPTRVGYTFDGWYSDINLTTPFIFNTMPAEDLILYAKWIPIN